MEKRPEYPQLASLSPEQWSFIAGLFVGEGCFSISERTNGSLRFEMRIKMADKDVLVDVQSRLGGSLKLADKAGTRDLLRDIWLWRIHDGYLIVQVIEHLMPYLQGDKMRQAQAYLTFAKLKLSYWEQGIQHPMAPEHRRALLQAAFDARSFALGSGGPTKWRERWASELAELTNAQALGTT